MTPSCRALLALVLSCPVTACSIAVEGTHEEAATDAPAQSVLLPASTPSPTSAPQPESERSEAQVTPIAEPKRAPAAAPACPLGMVKVDSFCIDRYEAHLVSRAEDGSEVRHAHFERPEAGARYEARSVASVMPQAYISRVESEAACHNAGKRLCSMREWRRACEGSAHTTYPYGRFREEGRCNTGKPHLLTLRFGGNPGAWTVAHFNDPSLAQEPNFLAKTGAYEGCLSDAGVADLVGNLHEWVSDTATATLRARLASDGIQRAFQYWSPGNGVFMGGFFSTQGELGPGCSFTTIAHEPSYHDYSTGFRCCADEG